MRIGIVTLSTPNIETYCQYTRARNCDYAEQHKYQFIAFKEKLDDSRPASWSKLLALLMNWDDYDWLMWIDADAMIMNKDIKLESIIDNKYDFIVSTDLNGINCGIFLVKTTEFMRQIFEQAYDKKEFINHPWWEQAALMSLMNENEILRQKTKKINKKEINSYMNDFEKGDFILHLPGFSNDTRYLILKGLFE